jgi:archaellum biogenesis protein FlaJ (TadC family)
MIFFLFFNLSSLPPFISSVKDDFLTRIVKVLWIPFVLSIGTFILMYFYPSIERTSVESRIDHELPFATIHMSAISGANISPSKIFEIVVATREYPNLEKEFNKVINDMHVFGKIW